MAAGQSTVAELVAKLSLDTQEFEKGSKGAGDSVKAFGDLLTKSFVKAGVAVKVLSGAFDMVKKAGSAAVNAFTTTVSESRKAFATYQQLEGGIETLFGTGGRSLEEFAERAGLSVEKAAGKYDLLMEAQTRVMENAHNAWQTAGLSANDYMNTVTGFAAALKQSTSNTVEAADVADMAVRDMADNANKMGTSMDAVQQAYQGFAKGQYQLLDNLKLGYGGTKTEMERLLQDAQAITGVKYDIDNLKDVYTAIHVIQEELDITGTTSREAASTIEGSTKALQAAWQNALVSMAGAGEDVESAFMDVGTALENWLLNVGPQMGKIMGGIGEALYRVVPQIGERLMEAIPAIVPKFVAGGIKLGIGLVTGIGQGVKVLWQLLGEVWAQFKKILDGLGLKQLGINILHTIWDGIQIAWNEMLAWFYTELGNLIAKLEAWLTEKLGKLAELPIIKDLFADLKTSLDIDLGGGDLQKKGADRKAKADQLRDEKTVLLEGIKDDMRTFGEDLFNKCDDILEGEEGISGVVNKNGQDIVGAIGSSSPGGESDYTLLDVIQDDRKRWYETYTIGGNYDLDLLRDIQGHVDLLQSKGIYITNADVLGETVPPEIRSALQTVSAAKVINGWEPTVFPEDLPKNADVQGVTNAIEGKELELEVDTTDLAKDASVQGVTKAVGEKEWDPTIETPPLDPSPIVSAISEITITVNYTAPSPDTSGIVSAIESVTVEVTAEIPTDGIESAIRDQKIEPTIKATIYTEPTIKATVNVPDIEVDTSGIDASAAAMSTAATNLDTSADNLTTSADNLTTSATQLSLATPQEVRDTFSEYSTFQNKWNVSGSRLKDEKKQQPQETQELNIPAVPENVIQSYIDLADAVERINTALESAAALFGFGEEVEDQKDALTFTIPPVDEATIESWQLLALAVRDVLNAFTGGGGEEEQPGEPGQQGQQGGQKQPGQQMGAAEGAAEGMAGGLSAAFAALPEQFKQILKAAQALTDFFTDEFIGAIEAVILVLAVVTVDEEGTTDASEGNTLYTALGAVFGLFSDLCDVSERLARIWTGTLVEAILTLKERSQVAIDTCNSLAGAANGAADAFWGWAAAIWAVIDALQALDGMGSGGYGGGGGGGGGGGTAAKLASLGAMAGNSPAPGGAAAEGAHVHAGETWLVGEEGPELFSPTRSGYIIPNDELKGSAGDGEGGQTINIHFDGPVYGEKYLKDYVTKTMMQSVRKELRVAG